MTDRDVYIAIMAAASKGCGLRLSAKEVTALSFDDAIATRASNATRASIGLTEADKAAQGKRCSCNGTDDLCPRQNVRQP